jgi:hypothetical protein
MPYQPRIAALKHAIGLSHRWRHRHVGHTVTVSHAPSIVFGKGGRVEGGPHKLASSPTSSQALRAQAGGARATSGIQQWEVGIEF